MLIGWAEVGPALLQAIHEMSEDPQQERGSDAEIAQQAESTQPLREGDVADRSDGNSVEKHPESEDKKALLVEACSLDTQHWQRHGRPISADTLRRELRIGTAPARELVRSVRKGYQPSGTAVTSECPINVGEASQDSPDYVLVAGAQ